MFENPFFKASTFQGMAREFDSRDQSLPLLGTDPRTNRNWFPRRSYEGETVKLRVRVVEARSGGYTTPDGPSRFVKPGRVEFIEVTPLYARHARHLKSSEAQLFRQAGELIEQMGEAVAGESAVVQNAQEKLIEVMEEVRSYNRELMHAAIAGALQGTYTYSIDGFAQNIDYQLQALTAPAIAWDVGDGTAIPVTNIHAMKVEFKNQSGGKMADTVFFHPDLFNTALLDSTQWNALVLENPSMNAAFLGAMGTGPGSSGNVINFTAMAPFILFNMLWVPVDGDYVDDDDGSTVLRWPVGQLTIAAWGSDLQDVAEHAMVQDDNTPNPSDEWKTWQETGDKSGWNIRNSDNGGMSIRLHRRVQTWNVFA